MSNANFSSFGRVVYNNKRVLINKITNAVTGYMGLTAIDGYKLEMKTRVDLNPSVCDLLNIKRRWFMVDAGEYFCSSVPYKEARKKLSKICIDKAKHVMRNYKGSSIVLTTIEDDGDGVELPVFHDKLSHCTDFEVVK